MPAEVVDLAAVREARQPHQAGDARCLACGHEWQAVAPTGTTQLECPSCKTEFGVFKYPAIRGTKVWECNCGCDVFRINPDMVYCYRCGEQQNGY